MLEKWQVFDDEHAVCADCGTMYEIKSLVSGRCLDCRKQDDASRRHVLSLASLKSVQRASRELLAAFATGESHSKVSSEVMAHFFRKIGGPEKFSELMLEAFDKAHGRGLSGSELEVYSFDPKTQLQWFKLLMDVQQKDDASKTFDPSSLTQEEILDALKPLARDMAKSDAEFRRFSVEEAIKADPSLINVALDAAGKPALTAVVGGEKVEVVPLRESGMEEDEAFDGGAN